MLLQSVLEAVSGQNFSDFISSQVFRPLGMRRSSLVWHEQLNSEVHTDASPGLWAPRPGKFKHALAAASLYTTAPDYAKFLCAVLRQGKLIALTLSSPVWWTDHLALNGAMAGASSAATAGLSFGTGATTLGFVHSPCSPRHLAMGLLHSPTTTKASKWRPASHKMSCPANTKPSTSTWLLELWNRQHDVPTAHPRPPFVLGPLEWLRHAAQRGAKRQIAGP
jgi:CubicO group peptidase (beta-lactamase class C family)